MRKSFLHLVTLALVAMGFVACSVKSGCDSDEVKIALAESIKQEVGDEARINYDSFVNLPITSEDYMIQSGEVAKGTTFICEVDATISLKNNLIFRDVIKYAPQYDYNNKLYIKVVEGMPSKNRVQNLVVAVAVARADLAKAQKAIVAKVFADNIDVTKPKAPNGESWGEWIMKISGLHHKKWKAIDNGIYPIDRMEGRVCNYDVYFKKLPILWINTKTGAIHFNPSKLLGSIDDPILADFCSILKESFSGYFENDAYLKGWRKQDDKIISLK